MTRKKAKEKLSDIQFLKAGVEKLRKHLAKNKHDYRTKRALLIKEAKLHKLEKYLKKRGK